MKTTTHKTKSAPGLQIRSSNHQPAAPVQTPEPVSAPAPEQTPAPPAEQKPQLPPLPRIDFARREANRALPTEQLLSLLRTEAPRFFDLAEVVGRWVWIQFTNKQPREVTATLAQLGFHWNNKRQTWQHPCGALTPGTESNPREKYPTYFPADAKPA